MQDRGIDVSEYCRAIETHLCRKNDGHLIRVVGPAFELVSRWATEGVPLKVAFAGIDRCVERYFRKGRQRRRPVRIEFCEADVLEAFDEWRRATGVTRAAPVAPATGVTRAAPVAPATGLTRASNGAERDVRDLPRRGPSLPEHLERVVLRLTNARATGSLGADVDAIIDDLSLELDRARAQAGGVRGEARRAAVGRLAAADAALMDCVAGGLNDETRAAIEREAVEELAAYRDDMSPDAFNCARQAAVLHLIRTRFGLPTIVFG